MIIPQMTHPLSQHWDQPSVDDIEIDGTHALMSSSTFDKLHTYSTSQPSGVYEGKMWKSQLASGEWVLRWFGDHPDDDMVSNHCRSILVDDIA